MPRLSSAASLITSSGTLAVLSSELEAELADLGVTGGLTLAHATGDDRLITMLISRRLRDTVTLYDGTQPLGVRFVTKHGHPRGSGGVCWEYWMRATDAGLPEPVLVLDQSPVDDRDPDLLAAQRICRIEGR